MRSIAFHKLELLRQNESLRLIPAEKITGKRVMTRNFLIVASLLFIQLIWNLPVAEAKHNRFIGTPRSSVTQTDAVKPESGDRDEQESESVSIDQPEPVNFSSEEDFSTSTESDSESFADEASVRQELLTDDDHNLRIAPGDIVDHAHEEAATSTSSSTANARVNNNRVDDVTAASTEADIGGSEPLAVTWYREKAELGDMDAQYNLAMISETGFGIEKDEQAAVKWYSLAAKEGHAEAQLKLGMLYLLGVGAPESRIKGGKWVRSAARQDNRFARVLSEKFLSKNIEGLDVNSTLTEVRSVYNSSNPKRAEEKLLVLIAQSEIQSQNRPKKERFAGGITGSGAKSGSVGNRVPDFLADKKTEKTEGSTSLARIRRHAKEGVAEAQYEWGLILEKGDQVPVDREHAVKWFQAAAEQNHPGGLYKLAIADMYGIGVPLDFVHGKELLARSARQNHPVADQLLKYIGRTPGSRNSKKMISITIAWQLQKAIEQKNGNAMLSLGYMFQNGWGVQADHNESTIWMNRAKAAGSTEASRAIRISKVSEMADDGEFSKSMNREMTRAIVGNSIPENDNKKIARAVSRMINNVKTRAKDLLGQDAEKQKPLMLLGGGLVLGFMVFRIMRRPGNRHSHSAY